MIPFFLFHGSSRSSEPSCCQLNHCKCTCHRERWYDHPLVIIPGTLISLLIGACVLGFILVTFVDFTQGHQTLFETVKGRLGRIADLLRRLW